MLFIGLTSYSYRKDKNTLCRSEKTDIIFVGQPSKIVKETGILLSLFLIVKVKFSILYAFEYFLIALWRGGLIKASFIIYLCTGVMRKLLVKLLSYYTLI